MKRGKGYTRGQISIFIILGIVIVGVTSFIYFTYIDKKDLNDDFFSQLEIQPQIENIQANILTCIDLTGEDGLKIIGKQGGYYNDKPFRSLNLNDTFIPYYYYEGESLVPSNEEVEGQLKSFMDSYLSVCFDGLYFEGFNLSHNNIISNVVINSKEVVFTTDSQFTISKDNRSTIFYTRDSPISKSSSLNDILEVARYITDSHKLDSREYCISCISQISTEKDVYIWFSPLLNNSVQIIIGENKTSDDPYLFNFLNKYTGNEISNDSFLNGNLIEGMPGGVL